MKRLARRAAPLLLALVVAAPAGANHTRQSGLDDKIAAARARESALAGQIDGLTTQIRALEQQVGDVSTRLGSLESDLTLHRRRLQRINDLARLQDEQLRFLKTQYRKAVARLGERLVQIYENGEPSTIEVVLGAQSLKDALDRLDFMSSVAAQDRAIVTQVGAGRIRVRAARVRTRRLQQSVASSTRVIAYRTQQVRALRDQLDSRRRSLAGVRSDSQGALAATRASEREWVAEASALQAASASVSSTITSQPSGSSSSPPSSSGLIWPVSGPITSPFGMRWGSLHPGIDIGVGMGTPIHAAASGRVISASYSGGYGNLVVIDHGNGLATAYAHQSSMAVSAGQQVSQGQVIGYVGSTGFSTGPHLHFEVRVNGSPVDPMGYL